MRVLGLDPGSRRTGWGVVEQEGRAMRYVACGHIAPAARLGLPDRLFHIVREVREVLERFRPQQVVIESAFHHEFARSTLVLGHVRGALLVTAVEHGLSVSEYAPRAIKLAVTGNGAAGKEQVARMVQARLGLDGPPQADAADALAGALCHLQRARLDAPRRRTPAAERLQALIASARAAR